MQVDIYFIEQGPDRSRSNQLSMALLNVYFKWSMYTDCVKDCCATVYYNFKCVTKWAEDFHLYFSIDVFSFKLISLIRIVYAKSIQLRY